MTDNKKPIWRFPMTFIGGGLGFNDGGTQLFKDDSIQSLAREVCQNSIDARAEGTNRPVEVEFSTFNVSREEFPGYDEFLEIIQSEINYCNSYYHNNKNAVNYYKDALATLKSEQITCLRISDFNTDGLTIGKDEKNNNWMNLVVHSGTNDKKEEDGGSFGLGKNAMYACSKLGTLYFSTYDKYEEKRSECVSKLSFYYVDDTKIIHGLGFYGNYDSSDGYENDKPIKNLCNLDKNFTRRNDEKGTDIYILGFELPMSDIIANSSDNFSKFEKDIAAAIIDNYFEAILNNKLVVKINDMEINSSNINELFNKLFSNYPELFNINTADYLDVLLNNEETKTFPICIMNPSVQDAELKIKLNPKFHNRIAMIRNTGMKIFDKGNFPQLTIFSGTLVLQTKEVNGYFKSMENPSHDGWMLDRIKNDPTAKIKYDNMFNQIRDIIKKLAKDNAPETLDVVGLGEYLPDDVSEGTDDNKKENIVDEFSEKIDIIEHKQIPSDKNIQNEPGLDDSIQSAGTPDENGEYDAIYGTGSKNETDNGTLTNHSAKSGQSKIMINKDSIVKNIKKRCFYSDNKYHLIIVSPQDIDDCKLVIEYAGETNNYNPVIKTAYKERKILGQSSLLIDENKVDVGKISKNEKTVFEFTLDENEDWSLEVCVYEN